MVTVMVRWRPSHIPVTAPVLRDHGYLAMSFILDRGVNELKGTLGVSRRRCALY